MTYLANPDGLRPVLDGSALLSGFHWPASPSGATVLTYSFATTESQYDPLLAAYTATLAPFSEADKAMTRALLATISSVCNVTFVEVPDAGGSHGQIRYAYSAAANEEGYAALTFLPGSGVASGEVWIGSNQAGPAWDWYRPDLVLHETLHALGLKHPFEGPIQLDARDDVLANTVMSYSAIRGSQSGWLAVYPTEPMGLDVAALQALYGAAEHNGGDTVYHLADPQWQAGFHALWDSGGYDVLDASALNQPVLLDLREGGHSDIGVRVAAGAYFTDAAGTTLHSLTYTQTLTIDSGTVIEGAIGTSGDDQFICGANTDVIEGGAGQDTAVFLAPVASVHVAIEDGAILVTHDNHTTRLTDVEVLSFQNADLVRAPVEATAPSSAAYAQAFRLYQAALDRLPDQDGLVFQACALQSGTTLPQLAGNFMNSPEFQARFGAPDDATFVTLLYHNVLHREPEPEGLAYHLGWLARGVPREYVLVGFSESPENQANTAVTLIGMAEHGLLVPV